MCETSSREIGLNPYGVAVYSECQAPPVRSSDKQLKPEFVRAKHLHECLSLTVPHQAICYQNRTSVLGRAPIKRKVYYSRKPLICLVKEYISMEVSVNELILHSGGQRRPDLGQVVEKWMQLRKYRLVHACSFFYLCLSPCDFVGQIPTIRTIFDRI